MMLSPTTVDCSLKKKKGKYTHNKTNHIVRIATGYGSSKKKIERTLHALATIEKWPTQKPIDCVTKIWMKPEGNVVRLSCTGHDGSRAFGSYALSYPTITESRDASYQQRRMIPPLPFSFIVNNARGIIRSTMKVHYTP